MMMKTKRRSSPQRSISDVSNNGSWPKRNTIRWQRSVPRRPRAAATRRSKQQPRLHRRHERRTSKVRRYIVRLESSFFGPPLSLHWCLTSIRGELVYSSSNTVLMYIDQQSRFLLVLLTLLVTPLSLTPLSPPSTTL